MSDLSPAHMQARAVLRGMDKHMKILFPPQPSHNGQPPLVPPRVPTFSQSERALVGAWKAYLKWEEGNPLELDEKDKSVLIQRVQAVYRKAVIRMRYFAEIWRVQPILVAVDAFLSFPPQVSGVRLDTQCGQD